MTKKYNPIPLPHRSDYSDEEMIKRAADFYDHAKKRHTCRFYSDRDVPREIIEKCLLAAGTAPSGANHQPWHFVLVRSPKAKKIIRKAAEVEEREFYAGKAGKAWLEALAPIGTDWEKPFLEVAPWLIVVFAQRYGHDEAGNKIKHYYVPESVGIATGMLITSLHNAGLSTLTHTPAPMSFLNELCHRPEVEKPVMILVTGHPAEDATVPKEAKNKKTLEEISSQI
ncbi:MAG: nitroreductase family protein [Sphingomonadales bacterium]